MLVGFCQYKGMIFRRTDDPRNSSGDMCLFEGLLAVNPYGRKLCAWEMFFDRICCFKERPVIYLKR